MKVLIHASTANEAIEKMMGQKKISTKINYDILKELTVKPSTSPARQIAQSPKGATPGAQRLTGQYRKPTNVTLSLGTPLSTLGKRLRPFISAQPHKKLALDQVR
uniref:transcription factor IIIB 90 kDa subunit-like n=1 Tax=Oncorhynchus gorbuscha TaxID=8017 RepID=UPI001EAF206A|nr:transcription factor IIIB 90 kDa subunit-like [Oncorhynchus gorbuscha]